MYTPDGMQPIAICFDNENSAYLSTTGGVYISNDNCETWEFIGLDFRTVYSLSISHEGSPLAGTNYGIYLYDSESSTWEQVYLWQGKQKEQIGAANIISLEKGFGSTIYAGSDMILRSTDDGYNWEEVFELGVQAPYDFCVVSEDTVYVATSSIIGNGGVYYSVDGGEYWATHGLESHFARTIEKNSSGDLFTGCIGQYYYGWGGIYKLEQGSQNWDTLFYHPRVTSIATTEEDVVFCGYWNSSENWGGVMHSEDDGETWIIDTAGLENKGVSKIKLDNHENLYAICGHGTTELYRTVLPVSDREIMEDKTKIGQSYCYPNPFSKSAVIYFDGYHIGNTPIILQIYSISGEIVYASNLTIDEHYERKVQFQANKLKRGLFFYTLSTEKYFTSGKIIHY